MKKQTFSDECVGFNQDDYYDGKDLDEFEEEIRKAEYNRYMRKDPSTVSVGFRSDFHNAKHNE